jgi:hypothetical protein
MTRGRHFLAPAAVLGLTTVVAAGPPLTPAERQTRLAEIRAGIARTATGLERNLAQPQAVLTRRDLPNLALFRLATGADPREAERLLRLAFADQDTDPHSKEYGSLSWLVGSSAVSDENMVEFGTQAVGPILLEYGGCLSPEFRKELQPHLRASVAALRRRTFRTPAYTNIFLMKAVNLILLGEAAGDATAADDGYAELDHWIAYTRETGIHEFDSPTYYAVDLNSLGLGYRYARRPGAREKFRAILDYFWSDIAANTFRGHLAGPNSRNYDFLRDAGGLDCYLYAEGILPALTIDKLDLEKVYVLVSLAEKGYHPDAKVLALADGAERVVRQRWDTRPGTDRYHYLTPGFALGSAGGSYGPQDRLLTAELASAKDLPVITVVPDVFDEPYGKRKTKDRSGHNKPTHLPLNAAAVQERGALLALLDLDAAKAPETDSLATNVLLPARADALRLDGKPVSVETGLALTGRRDCVVGVREGESAVVVRVFRADGCAGQVPVPVLKADAVGLASGAARLAVYHYQGPARRLEEPHVRVGLLVLAEHCRDDRGFAELLERVRAARIEDRDREGVWTVRARVGDVELEARHDLKTGRIRARRVNGREMETAVLSLNGTDLAAPSRFP